jgi:hypothetical protein
MVLSMGLPAPCPASSRLNADKVRLVTDVCCLERGDIFEGSRNDVIVRIGSSGKDRGIGLARLDVVIGRIVQEVTEIRFSCRRPIFV